MSDSIKIIVLEDGTIKADSGPVSPLNHMSAEAFLRFVQQAAGGEKQDRKHKQGMIGAAIHALQHKLGASH